MSKTTPVPQEYDSWEPICWFALSYNGYERYGTQPGDIQGTENLAEFANLTEDQWRRDGSLPDSLHELRSVLFLEQRRSGHMGFFDPRQDWENPRSDAEEWKDYMRSLIRAIRAITGDVINMPPDIEKDQ